MEDLPILTIVDEAIKSMHEEVQRWAPEEACGLAAGRPGQVARIFPVANRLHSPSRFEMDPLEQLRAFQVIEGAGLELVAIYHSHPLGPPEPSPTDLEEFAYPGVYYLIWMPVSAGTPAEWSVRGFDLDGGKVREIRVEVR